MASDEYKHIAETGTGAAPAKITRPVLSGVVARTRLFNLLDTAKARPITWIVAPPGSGKTTLIASYLEMLKVQSLWYQMDPSDGDIASFFYYLSWATRIVGAPSPQSLPLLTDEYRKGLASFTHNFFRELFNRLPQPGVLVLDDYQQVDTAAHTHDIIQQGFDQIPANLRVFVISREEPHGAFARLRASGRIALLPGEELRLTEEETAELIAARANTVDTHNQLAQSLHRRTHGWVAGIVLLTESAISGEPIGEAFAQDDVVFDYFANEIFRHGSTAVQEILIKTAFFPKITASLACQITQRKDCDMLLNDLARRGYFTVQRAIGYYEYHPLFRAFLISRAMEAFDKTALHDLKTHSAHLLAEVGEIEAAMELFQQELCWQEAHKLLLQHARTYLEQGRAQTLGTMIDRFPADMRATDAWLLYFQGACQFAVAPAQARAFFELAFVQFETHQDSSPLYSVWVGIIESIIFESKDYTPMHAWIKKYPTLAQGREPPDPDIASYSLFTYLDALRTTWPDHPDFIPTGERAEIIFQQERITRKKLLQALILLFYYLWRGQVSRARELLETLEPVAKQYTLPHIERIIWQAMRGLYSHSIGSTDETMNAVHAGLTLAESTGVRALDDMLTALGISSLIRVGNSDEARDMLQYMASRMDPSHPVCPFYHTGGSAILLQDGNPAGALEEAQRATQQLATTGNFVLGKMYSMLYEACALAELKRLDEAFASLAEAYDICQRGAGKLFASHCLHVRAHLLRLQGDYEGSLDALRASLDLAHEMEVCTVLFCRREDNAVLFSMALDAGIHYDYVSSMIVKMRLQPPHLFSENWPWSLRIYTLGRFVMIKDGESLHFDNGKAQLKPLELLRTLVSHGGRNVSFQMIATILWPGSDVDVAKTALETTLHRLRRLLGEKCIVKHLGLLSLNAEYCWLDAWAFEDLTDNLEAAAPGSASIRRLVELYRGSFLPNDESSAAVAQRERLRSKFLRAVVYYGKQYESLEQWQDALSLYQQGIEADPTAEELHRLVMQCYRRLGRFAEAIAAYRRCQRVLAAELNVEPSLDSQLLHRAISSEVAQPL